ncbi:hypothetical protein SUGI_0075210 [Cryptomeria japonica]|nr:hypothetical protein SUGI_0075210 [Cryptomeria japonica]
MSGLLNKRSREEEALQDSSKRFHCGTEQQNLYTLEDFEFPENFQETEPKCCASEEAVCADLRDFEEEIGAMSPSASEQGFSGLNREDDSLASDMTSGYGNSEDGIDLCYLLEASDDELGIPPTPVYNFEGEENSGFASDFNENADLKDFLEKWHFEDNFVDCREFSLIEDSAAIAWDDLAASQGLFVDGDCYQSWGLENAGDL